MMNDGITTQRTEDTPQGSPWSPLLSNIMLDVLDKERTKRGHAFCRYADDCNIDVRSEKAALRVMVSLTTFMEKHLKMTVDTSKSS
jgi:RNA-directed DNA polymerase